jgi:hypothetical protein
MIVVMCLGNNTNVLIFFVFHTLNLKFKEALFNGITFRLDVAKQTILS